MDSLAPAWTMLDDDLHLQALNPDYAPLGLLAMVPADVRSVLDIGCFCGGSGRVLKQRQPEISVTGIELLEPAAALASSHYDRVIVSSVEAVDLDQLGRFDAVIAADVLEHLVNPWKLLQRLRPTLTSGGALFASIPNVRNLRILEQLANGRWPHERAGIHDVSHLRFFTRAEICAMFEQTGWSIDEIRINPDPSVAEQFKNRDLDQIRSVELPNLVLKNLTRDDLLELIALQFLIRARPGSGSS